MNLARFRVLKHASAAAFALSVVGVFLFGLDGFLGAVHRLGFLFAAPPAPVAPAPEPVAEAPAADGVVRVVVLPDDGAAPPPGKDPPPAAR